MKIIMDLPQDLISLVLEFAAGEDVIALPLFHVSEDFKKHVTRIQKRKQPYPRRLFYELKISDIKHLSLLYAVWLASIGADFNNLTILACRVADLEVIKWVKK